VIYRIGTLGNFRSIIRYETMDDKFDRMPEREQEAEKPDPFTCEAVIDRERPEWYRPGSFVDGILEFIPDGTVI
jgi:hypothetical protein